jgi:hypothetical protein
MLARIERIGTAQSAEDYNRKDVSPLMLCGYSVAKTSGLTESQRHALLAKLMDERIFSKTEIMSHIDMLVNTNGEQPKMSEARSRWLTDLAFVRDCRINEQYKALIRDISPDQFISKKHSFLKRN